MRRSNVGVLVIGALLLGVPPLASSQPAPPNDACASPTVVSALPFSADVDVTTATSEAGDPQLCNGADQGTNSVWFSFTPPATGTFRAYTFASAYDTVLAVYSGSCGTLVQSACDDDYADSLTSQLIFQASQGTPLLIEVAGFDDKGTLHFTLDSLPDKPTGKAFNACQKTIKKSAGKFVGKALKAADRCVNGLLKCVQNGSDSDCIAKGCQACQKKLQTGTDLSNKLRDNALKSCAGFPFEEMLKTSGLGYELRNAECAASAVGGLTDLNAVADCVAGQHVCKVARLFQLEEPRVRELGSLCGILPPDFACLDNLGSGGAISDESERKALLKCEGAIKKAATKFVTTKLKNLEKCADSIFTCIATKPADQTCVNGDESAGGKVGGAKVKCDKAFLNIANAEDKVAPTIDKGCADISFDTLKTADGANIQALATECATLGVPALNTLADYETCLVRHHECLTEDLLRFESPFAEGLLGLVNPGPPPLTDVFCPQPFLIE